MQAEDEAEDENQPTPPRPRTAAQIIGRRLLVGLAFLLGAMAIMLLFIIMPAALLGAIALTGLIQGMLIPAGISALMIILGCVAGGYHEYKAQMKSATNNMPFTGNEVELEVMDTSYNGQLERLSKNIPPREQNTNPNHNNQNISSRNDNESTNGAVVENTSTQTTKDTNDGDKNLTSTNYQP